MEIKPDQKTLVFGASLKAERYSNMAIKSLRRADLPVKAIGLREGVVADVDIIKGYPEFDDIHTVTIYMNAKRQQEHEDYLTRLSPERVIFNPGAENPDFMARLKSKGIEAMEACTLVLLSIGAY